MLLHALFFSAKVEWLKKGEIKWSRPEPITLALICQQPPKPQPTPQRRIVPPKPKPVPQKKEPPKKIVAPLPPPRTPLPPPQAPLPPEKRDLIPETKEVLVEEVQPESPMAPPIQKLDESIINTIEPEEEEKVMESASTATIQSIDAYIVEDMDEAAPKPKGPLPEASLSLLPNPKPLPLQIAVPTHKENPIYPRIAKRRGYEGTVVLKVLVGVDGSVADLEILESSGYRILDHEAEKSIRKWLFEPWKRGEESIEMWGKVIVSFKLK